MKTTIKPSRCLHQKGFSIVEIAIALVIIGLLIGAVLQTQSLIKNSKIKNVTEGLDNMSVAYHGYKDRTGNIAGDTDADGRINSETLFWQELRAEGFITGDSNDTSAPNHPLSGTFIVATENATAFDNKNYICATNIENTIAERIDSKLDNGLSATGIIRSQRGTTLPISPITEDYNQSKTATVVCKEL